MTYGGVAQRSAACLTGPATREAVHLLHGLHASRAQETSSEHIYKTCFDLGTYSIHLLHALVDVKRQGPLTGPAKALG